MISKNRIPYEYFIVKGKGESDIGIHTGSFDQALSSAGIGNQNIIFYSSILPPIAKKIKKPSLDFGSVLETIMAVKNGNKNEKLTAGIGIAWIYKGKIKIGGLVAEYTGNENKKIAKEHLVQSLEEMFNSRFKNKNKYAIKKIEIHIESFVPKKRFGTVLVGLCFYSYIYHEKEKPIFRHGKFEHK